MDTLLREVGFAVRQLSKAPLLTALAVLSFGLGVGANTTLYTWAKALVLDPYPAARDAAALVAVHPLDPRIGETNFSYPDYRDVRDRARTLAGLIATRPTAVSVGTADQPLRVFTEIVSGNYFDVLGVPLAHGRGFLPSEDEVPLRDAVIVLSYDLWVRTFGADPGMVGRTITVNSRAFTVLGIAGEGFYGTRPGLAYSAWVPMMVQEWAQPGGAGLLEQRGNQWMAVLGRLAPGVTIQKAQAELGGIMQAIDAEYPQNAVLGSGLLVSPLWRAPQTPAEILGPLFAILAGLGILVLAIASANVAALLVARGLARQREIAVRTALGASPGRVVRQLLAESLVLALLGGACGLGTAFAGAGLLERMIPPTDFPLRVGANVDAPALGVALALSLLCGLVFGLMPALQAARPDVAVALREASTAVAGGGATARWFRRLVMAQIAAATVLLIAAGLFLRSADNAREFRFGFDARGIWLTGVDLFSSGYDRDAGLALFDRVAREVSALPGVASVALARRVPLGFGGSSSTSLTVAGYAPAGDERPFGFFNVVSPGYFRTLSTPVLAGREFLATDRADSRAVAVINEAMASKYFSDSDPVGRTFSMGAGELEIVGVVKNSLFRDLSERPTPWFYLPLAQSYRSDMTLFTKTAGDPAALAAPVRDLLKRIDPRLALASERSFTDSIQAASIRQSIGARMLGLLGAMGLILATVGLFGTLAFGVAQRSRELSVRMALGCARAGLVSLVLRDAGRVLAWGLGIGTALALAAALGLRTLLIGIAPWDPLVFAAVLSTLAVASALATLVPGWRAASVDPIRALRAD